MYSPVSGSQAIALIVKSRRRAASRTDIVGSPCDGERRVAAARPSTRVAAARRRCRRPCRPGKLRPTGSTRPNGASMRRQLVLGDAVDLEVEILGRAAPQAVAHPAADDERPSATRLAASAMARASVRVSVACIGAAVGIGHAAVTVNGHGQRSTVMYAYCRIRRRLARAHSVVGSHSRASAWPRRRTRSTPGSRPRRRHPSLRRRRNRTSPNITAAHLRRRERGGVLLVRRPPTDLPVDARRRGLRPDLHDEHRRLRPHAGEQREGRTTCSFFYPDGRHILYGSTFKGGDACPPKPDFTRGYVWPVYDTYDIFRANADGSGIEPLTTTPGTTPKRRSRRRHASCSPACATATWRSTR